MKAIAKAIALAIGSALICLAAAFSLVVLSAHMDSVDDRVPFLWIFPIVGSLLFAGSFPFFLFRRPGSPDIARATLLALIFGAVGGISVWGIRHFDEQRTIDFNRRIVQQQDRITQQALANSNESQP